MRHFMFLLTVLLVSGGAWASGGSMPLDMTPGVTTVSQDIFDLHRTIFWICVVIGIIVFGAMVWAMIFHRKSRGHKPASFHHSTTVEIVWTVIPFAILIAMAIPATKVLVYAEDTDNSDMTVLVKGYQWKWQYKYMNYQGEDLDVNFFSNLATHPNQIRNIEEKSENYLLEVDNPLVVPAGKKVRVLLTAADVIHSWWVPEFGVKKDAIPGFINQTWFKTDKPGIYRGQCTELCGKDHGFMPVVVKVLPEEEFNHWLSAENEKFAAAKAEQDHAYGREWPLEELMAEGEKVYAAKCAACHGLNGEGIPGAFPALKGSPVALGDVKTHINVVVNGVAGTGMQAFKEQLNDIETAAVVTYERNAWGNNVGDTAQPRDVRDFNTAHEEGE
jgi:cytochrome c oxidase subunit 2